MRIGLIYNQKIMASRIKEKIKNLYLWLNDHTFGAVRVLRIALYRFGYTNATQAAAGMAYYAFFSLFPLLLFLIVGTSFVLENKTAYDNVMLFIFEVLPTAQSLVEANIDQVLKLRGAVGLLGVMGFLWSSSSFFSILARNINQAIPQADRRNFLEDKVIALSMIGLLALLLALSILSNTLTSVLPKINLFYWKGIPLHRTIVWRYIIKCIPFITSFGLFVGLYRYIPKKRLGWGGVWISSALAAISWQLATKGFTWLIEKGLVRYELVYGSLGAVVSLMFWIYLISTITLFGAHLAASIDMISKK